MAGSWTVTENGWTWNGDSPAPGSDPFHVRNESASLYAEDRPLDLADVRRIDSGGEFGSASYLPGWLADRQVVSTGYSSGIAQQAFYDSKDDYYYRADALLDRSGGYSSFLNPDSFTRVKNDEEWRAAVASGHFSHLNGKKTFDVLDRAGNVTETRTFTNLQDGDNADLWVTAAVGAVFGAVAIGAAAGAGGVAAETGSATAATGSGAFVGEGAASGVAAWDGALATAQGASAAVGTAAGAIAGDPLTYAKGALSLATTARSLFGGSGGEPSRLNFGGVSLPPAGSSQSAPSSVTLVPVGGSGDGGDAAKAGAANASASNGQNWILIGGLFLAGLAVAYIVRKN